MSAIERGVGFKNVFRDFARDVSLKTVTTGLVCVVFVMTFLLFFWAVLPNYKVEPSLMNTWMTGCLYIMGLGTILLAAYYRKPMGMAGSFTGWLCALDTRRYVPGA
jgi:benzoate membrane transport protein